jgi:hypothetical protein
MLADRMTRHQHIPRHADPSGGSGISAVHLNHRKSLASAFLTCENRMATLAIFERGEILISGAKIECDRDWKTCCSASRDDQSPEIAVPALLKI